jgi:hypothetical protein
MAKRGRPPSVRAASARIIRIKLRLYPGEDDDLIAFFEAVLPGLRAVEVKRALRSGVEESNPVQDQEPDDAMYAALDTFIC